ncbi:(d)CMP kinase [Methanobrevibacter filiformis]|uniref:Cytidylate kinase n=1 Tax=Methanobrevibacter filiformis TaxID=55758 RepID=A0A165ZHT5_9EURY|nr:AAA family ATPase [Methanobrevibacter filiformis]KZX10748.1 cytidylate kinase [Methanobrevibacter filiformis]
MIITVGGLAGSGTTTAAEVLSKKLNIPFISAGDIFRQMARESGMSVLEFSTFAEGNTDIDMEIDRRQEKIAKKSKEESKNLIIEGRLSAYFVEADIKIWMTAPLDVRTQRICNRESKSLDLAESEIKFREKSEAVRYLDIHNININNLDVYDLILNTHSFNPDSIAEIILTTLKVI